MSKNWILLSLVLSLPSCSLYRRGPDSKFYGVYKAVSPTGGLDVELHLEDRGEGFWLINGKEKVPILWAESLGRLQVTYRGSYDLYEAAKLVNERTGESADALAYLERPDLPFLNSPFTLLRMESSELKSSNSKTIPSYDSGNEQDVEQPSKDR